MAQKKDLKYYMKLKYNCLLKEGEECFYVFIPELSLIAEGEDPKEAYEKLEKEKELYFKRIISLNAEDTVKEPAMITARNKILSDLMIFSAKAIIVGMIVGGLLLGSLPFVNDVLINQRLNRIPSKAKAVLTQFSSKINNLSEEEKAQMRQKLKEIVQEIKPLIDEIKASFSENDFKADKGVKK